MRVQLRIVRVKAGGAQPLQSIRADRHQFWRRYVGRRCRAGPKQASGEDGDERSDENETRRHGDLPWQS
jgi:hypothetical protein